MAETTAITTDYRSLSRVGLEQLSEWEEIASTKKNEIISEFAGFYSCQEHEMSNKLRKGHHLSKAKALLGHGNFAQACEIFRINRRAAERSIEIAEKAEKVLPTEFLALAPPDLGGTVPGRPLGRYQDSITRNPPPKTRDKVKIQQWWAARMEDAGKDWGKRHLGARNRSPELVQHQLYLDVNRRLRQVSAKHRVSVFENVVGMLLASLGITSRRQFEPKAVPSGYNPKRGRPTKNTEE